MKSICFVSFQLSRGGTERIASLIANYLCLKNYRVMILTLENAPVDYYVEKSIEVRCLGIEKKDFSKNLIKKRKDVRKLIKDFDIVIAMNNRTILLVTLATIGLDIKRVFCERNDPRKLPKTFFERLIRNKCYKYANQIIFQTTEQKSYYRKIAPNKGVIIQNPVMDNLPYHQVEGCSNRVISACRYDYQKNIKMSIDAFKLFWEDHKGFDYYIYGNGPLKKQIELYVKNIGMSEVIHIEEFTNEIHKYMSEAMIFISSSNYEGISNSMLEAMAIGLPVICTDCPIGGARETIENGKDGVLIPVGDTEKMAEQLTLLADDLQYRKWLSNNAKKIRERLNINRICKKWEAAIIE